MVIILDPRTFHRETRQVHVPTSLDALAELHVSFHVVVFFEEGEKSPFSVHVLRLQWRNDAHFVLGPYRNILLSKLEWSK